MESTPGSVAQDSGFGLNNSDVKEHYYWHGEWAGRFHYLYCLEIPHFQTGHFGLHGWIWYGPQLQLLRDRPLVEMGSVRCWRLQLLTHPVNMLPKRQAGQEDLDMINQSGVHGRIPMKSGGEKKDSHSMDLPLVNQFEYTENWLLDHQQTVHVLRG